MGHFKTITITAYEQGRADERALWLRGMSVNDLMVSHLRLKKAVSGLLNALSACRDPSSGGQPAYKALRDWDRVRGEK